MAKTQAQKEAAARYNAQCTMKTLTFHKDKDKDILDYIQSTPNFTGLIKDLLRQHMEDKKLA